MRDEKGAVIKEFAEAHSWLQANCPKEAGVCIIHNDFRIGNLMWSINAPPRLLAILDWELATIGDPLLDLAYLLASIPDPGGSATPTQDLAKAIMRPDFPATVDLACRYSKATSRGMDALDWYMAMVNWKLAALYYYSRARGSDPYFAAPDHVPRFLAEARRHMGR